MRVICTAGHVDHGKSTLVRALTGMEPDRFVEEQRRGLTIDIGFAWSTVGEHTVAFVDLPGHERFIGNMLAGAGAVDLALFVVAADEGWMPQSQEHLEILDLLGVTRGLVAITKADTVDDDTVALAEELVREQLSGTAFAKAAMVAVSAVTGAGLDGLRDALADVLDAAPPPPDRGRPRLWVDRSFSIRGAGTVVTGTLGGGTLRVAQDIAVLPGGVTARVRSIEMLKAPATAAPPGSRVAVNVSGVAREAVRRGDAIALPEQWLAVTAFDATVRTVPGARVGRRGAWHLHAGSAERPARVSPVLLADISDGEGFVRVLLDDPLPLAAGDRFVLREAGRQATVGGGVVLDADPLPPPRGRAAREVRAAALAQRADAVRADDRAALLALHVAERGAADAVRTAAAVGVTVAAAQEAARAAKLLPLGAAWVSPDAGARWSREVVGAVAGYHEGHPVERAAPKDVAARAAGTAGCPRALVPAFLDALVRLGRLVAEGTGVRTPEHRVDLSPADAAARETLLGLLGAEPFAPPGLADAARRAGASTALVRELEASGAVVRVAADLAFTAEAISRAVGSLRDVYQREGPLTAARAKDALGTTRKYAVPLLEYLDRTGRTRREGDVRIVR